MKLQGKTAVVTGGAGGIGAAIVSRFEAEVARTFVVGRQSGGVRSLRADVTDEDAVEAAMESILGETSRLDVCVANAGISPTLAHVKDLDLETWRRIVDVNLTGVFLTLRAAARRMIAAGNGGRLLVTGSAAGLRGVAGASAYAASKFALRGLVQSMALELAPSITVNIVSPGDTDGGLNHSVRELIAQTRQMTPDEVGAAMEAGIPARRMGRPEEVAAAFAYLASDEAAYVTGSVLVIDGGRVLV
jgi:NAD(P)-dependent dehydrogenase (short-subunit alcohol dehydrogenase family)